MLFTNVDYNLLKRHAHVEVVPGDLVEVMYKRNIYERVYEKGDTVERAYK